MSEPPTKPYPEVVCYLCGNRYGRRGCGIAATWYPGTCGVCDEQVTVTEPRDFGGLTPNWQSHQPPENKENE